MSSLNVEQARFNMIEQQIRPWDVLDPEVLALLSIVKREDFVPPACKDLAFADVELPLGNGVTMLEPKLEARLLQEAAVKNTDKVLEIGAGSGYMAALLAARAEFVVTVEIEPRWPNWRVRTWRVPAWSTFPSSKAMPRAAGLRRRLTM